MRATKFRLWCPEVNKFIEPRQFRVDGYGDIFIISRGGEVLRADPGRFLLDQFIDACDRNKIEIFENDIIQDENRSLGVVKWCSDNNMFYIEEKRGSFYDEFSVFIGWDSLHVTGNTRSNPEISEAAE